MGNILPLSRGDGYAYRISMGDIRILTDRVANQIAAGEVVERPAAVVKELIENSIDAEATKIELEFRNGGKSYLRIEDDGHGMKQDQALLSLERHGTSKIRKASDLNEISTFGFRGEALPSISSVKSFCDENAGQNIKGRKRNFCKWRKVGSCQRLWDATWYPH